MKGAIVGRSGFVAAIGVLIVIGGLALSALRFTGSSPAETPTERLLSSLALGAIVMVPGALALVSLTGRPGLLLPAGLALMPLSFLSMAGVLLPLLIPAVLLLFSFGHRAGDLRGPPALAATAAAGTFLLAAILALLAHQDPRAYSLPNGGGSTSDVITATEASLSFVLSAAAVGVSARFAGRRS